MSESVIADFVASFNSEASARSEPVKGRILLSEKRLVLAADEGKVTIPLTAIFDVAVGHVPQGLGDFFSSTVTVAFERGGDRLVAAIEAGDDKIEKFTNVLFKALLNGTEMTVKHPARVGGRVTGESFEPAKLFLRPQAVRFKRADDTVNVALSTVSNFDRLSREINGASQSVLSVRHMPNGQSMMTLAAIESARKMSILGRYLRLEYNDLMSELEDVTVSDDEVEALVAIYSTGPSVSLANVLDMDGSQLTMVLNDLMEDGLVADGDEGPQLTPKGRVVVSNYLEEVNS
ncbi:MAG: CheF family chemotaxis protein [Haloarculaceae archaeon]